MSARVSSGAGAGGERRRLVICCDGTWNKPDELRGGLAVPTNVAKVALAVAGEGDDGVPQLLYYQRGVGTRRFQRVSGGAFGYGLSRNIRDCYRFLVENYRPGDELYFFGFSRGAYTARSTLGLVHNCGILRPEHADRIPEAYALYRSRRSLKHPSGIESRIFRRMYAHPDADIHFVGVWDTVGSLGIPIDGLGLPFVQTLWGFHDTTLSPRVRHAYQALAIDEQRGPFKPTMWTQLPPAPGAPRQTLEQVWFTGVHCDVGGGYREMELAEVALLWMVRHAARHGLAFDPAHFVVAADSPASEQRQLGARVAPDALGTMHHSRKKLYRMLPRYRRPLTPGDRQSVASSAVQRLRDRPDYRPPALARWVAEGRRVTAVGEGQASEAVAVEVRRVQPELAAR